MCRTCLVERCKARLQGGRQNGVAHDKAHSCVMQRPAMWPTTPQLMLCNLLVAALQLLMSMICACSGSALEHLGDINGTRCQRVHSVGAIAQSHPASLDARCPGERKEELYRGSGSSCLVHVVPLPLLVHLLQGGLVIVIFLSLGRCPHDTR